MCSFQDFRDGGESTIRVYHASAFWVLSIPTKIEVAFVAPFRAPGVPDYPETTSIVQFVTNDYNGVVYFVAAIGGGENTIVVRLKGIWIILQVLFSSESTCDWLLCDSSLEGINVGRNSFVFFDIYNACAFNILAFFCYF